MPGAGALDAEEDSDTIRHQLVLWIWPCTKQIEKRTPDQNVYIHALVCGLAEQ